MSAAELAQRVLELTRPRGEAEVVVRSERSGLARFAGSQVHQPTLVEDTTVQLTLLREGRAGTAVTNRASDEGLASLVERAESARAASPADPERPSPAPPFDSPEIGGFDEATAALSPDDLARGAAAAIEGAAPFGAYGYVTSGDCELAVAASTGLLAAQRFTDATALVLAADDGASGYASSTAWAWNAVDAAAAGREAAAKAERTRGAAGLDVGPHRAVLEPYAIAELLQWFAYSAFNGLALVEERSFLSGRLGEKVFDPRITLVDDALDTRGLPKAFDFEGTPKQRVTLVEEGVARSVVWDRTTAARAGAGAASTGHALGAEERAYGPIPYALALAPGEAESVDELVALVGEGIYVTRLHYLGIVNAREGILTGMTRDGTFRIRDGRLAEPLVNLRFTVAVPEVLADIPGLTRERSLVNGSDFYDQRYPHGALVPAIATARFDVTGTGSTPGL